MNLVLLQLLDRCFTEDFIGIFFLQRNILLVVEYQANSDQLSSENVLERRNLKPNMVRMCVSGSLSSAIEREPYQLPDVVLSEVQ